jgi:hypothetical protein
MPAAIQSSSSSSSSSDSLDLYIKRLGELLDSSGRKIEELQQQLGLVFRECKHWAGFYLEDADNGTKRTDAWQQQHQPTSLLSHFEGFLHELKKTNNPKSKAMEQVTGMLAGRLTKLQQQQQDAQQQQQQSAATAAQAVQRDAGGDVMLTKLQQQQPAQQPLLQEHAARQLLMGSPGGDTSSSSCSTAIGCSAGSSPAAAGVLSEPSWGSGIGGLGRAGSGDVTAGNSPASSDGGGAPATSSREQREDTMRTPFIKACSLQLAEQQQQPLKQRYGTPLWQPVFDDEAGSDAGGRLPG